MKTKLSIFNRSQLYNRASVAGFWLFVLLLIVLTQESKVISLFGLLTCYFLVQVGCAIQCSLINFIIKLSNLSAAYALKEKRQI
jgi:hypothetical protein